MGRIWQGKVVVEIGYFKIFVTIALAVLGWIIAHYYTTKRDIANKRREIRLEFLIKNYQILTNEISHREPSDELRESLENLLSDIQLFGAKEQVGLAKALAEDVTAGGSYELDPLINCLRDELRTELQLSKIKGNVVWLRLDE
jgi:hypothetical protein